MEIATTCRGAGCDVYVPDAGINNAASTARVTRVSTTKVAVLIRQPLGVASPTSLPALRYPDEAVVR
jgi:hypothetical protein